MYINLIFKFLYTLLFASGNEEAVLVISLIAQTDYQNYKAFFYILFCCGFFSVLMHVYLA